MFKAFFWIGKGERKHVLRAYGGGSLLLLAILAQIKIALLFNEWTRGFYDLAPQATDRPLNDLWACLTLFLGIATVEVFVGPIGLYLGRVYTLWWREAITCNYVPRWEKTRKTIEGASQRLEQNIQEFTGLIENVGIEFFRALLMLSFFIPLLFGLSEPMQWPFAWDGTLAVIAFFMSLGGIVISYFVGIRLPKYENSKRDADAAFRKQLVLAEEQRSLLKSGRGWDALFNEVLSNCHRLYRHYAYFDSWTVGYNKLMMLLPYMLCMPDLQQGTLSMGAMMGIILAFGDVQHGFSIVQKNWTKVTELRAVRRRLWDFEQVLEDTIASEPMRAEVIPLSVRQIQARKRPLKVEKDAV